MRPLVATGNAGKKKCIETMSDEESVTPAVTRTETIATPPSFTSTFGGGDQSKCAKCSGGEYLRVKRVKTLRLTIEAAFVSG